MTRRLMHLAPSRFVHSLASPCIANLVFLLLLVTNQAQAQVEPITQSGLNTQVNLSATPPAGMVQYDITGGTRPGTGVNLFHSFGEFGVPTNNIANFLNETGLPTSNILGRVTGGDMSTIFGTIQTSGFGNANLFLVNPAGFLFGPNATINVGGLVAVTSADYLRLADNARFNAIPNATFDALLTPSPVAAFGFLGSNPGAITVQGSQFSVTDMQGISLVGGAVTIQSGTLENGVAQPATLSTPNGNIQLASAASPGEFDATTLQSLPNMDGTSFTSFGTATFASGSTVDVSGTSTVSIRSGQFVLAVNNAVFITAESAGPSDTIALSRGSSIVTSNAGTDLEAANVAVTTGDFQMDGASMKSTTTGEGRGGDVSITAESISLVNGAQIVSAAEGSGTGGAVTLTTTDNVSISGFDIDGTLTGLFDDVGFVRSGVFTTTTLSGTGGAITVSASAVTLEEGGIIGSTTSGEGRGGNITVNAGTLTLSNGSQIVSTSGIFDFETEEIVGSGPGGDIAITAEETVLVSGVSLDLFSLSAISATTATIGKGGDITISGSNVTVGGSGAIVSSTAGEGEGGAINISATDTLLVTGFMPNFPNSAIVSNASSSGSGGAITIDTSSLLVNDRGIIEAESSGLGDGGALTVTAGNIRLTSGGAIETSGGVGASGTISLAADETLLVSGEFVDHSGPVPNVTRSRIVNRTTNGPGSNGGIDLVAREVLLTGGRIESQTGPGGGGDVSIAANDAITISGGLNVQAFTLGGTVGSLSFSAQTITLLDQATVTSTTASEANAGTMQFFTDTLMLRGGSIIRSNTEQGTGRGGAIVVDASDSVVLSGGSTIQSNTTTTLGGDAGSLTIQADNLVSLSGAGTGLLTEAGGTNGLGTGNGGTITVQTNQVQITDGAGISAKSTGSGAAGSVTIEGTTLAQSVLIDGVGSGIFTDTQRTGAGGNIFVNADLVTLQNGGTLSAKTSGTEATATGGSITVDATNQVTMTGGASITAGSTGPGDAGNVTISGASLALASGGRIESSTSGAGDGGSIAITTTGDVTVSGVSTDGQTRSGIFAKTQTSGGGSGGGGVTLNPGSAGDITVTANNLLLDGGAQIDSSTTSGGTGGTVSIATAENIIIAGSSTRLTSDATRGNGTGGNITLVARNISVRENASVSAATGGTGDAGNVTLTALDQLLLQSAGTITTSTSGAGTGGTITIQADRVLLDGQGTGISADTLRPFADMTITINILHPNVGDLVVQLDSPTGTRVALLSRVGGSGDHFTGTQFNDQAPSQITSGSAPFMGTFTPREPLGQLNNELVAGNWTLNVRDQATGNAGSLESWTLQIGEQTFQSTGGPRAILDNGNVRSSITVANPTVPTVQGVGEAPGIGGNVILNAGTVTVQNGATMSATTRGSGQGGTLTVNATGTVALNGSGSGLFTESEASGAGGNIALIAAQSMAISDGASVSSSSTGAGDAGNIDINAGQSFVATNSSVTTQANQASGGSIKITTSPSGTVQLTNSLISASVLDGTGGGGSVDIDPLFVILLNSQILAQAVQGPGGNIFITTNLLLPDANSVISASSQFGVNGTVTIQSPNAPASGKIQPLGQSPLLATSLLNQRCAALAGGEFSSFTVAGRDSLPTEPGGWLSSPLYAAGVGEGQGVRGEGLEGAAPILSLRQIAPAGFLTQSFAVDRSASCQS